MLTHLDVTIAGLGAAGLDTHSHKGIPILDELKRLDNALPVALHIQDEVVAGSDHHLGIGIDGLDVVGSPCDARRGVAANGFEQNLFGTDFGKLLLDERLIHLIGDEDDIVHGYNALHAVKCHLQQAASGAEEVEELFGFFGFAEGPETAPHASTHDDAI